MNVNQTEDADVPILGVIAFALVFGWTILGRPPDFSGWTLWQLAIGFTSVAFWIGVFHLVWVVVQ